MSRITLQAWLERTYVEGSRPTLNTVRRWAKTGKLPAIKEGREYYVEPDARYNAATPPEPVPTPERPRNLLDRVRAAETARRKEPRPPA